LGFDEVFCQQIDKCLGSQEQRFMLYYLTTFVVIVYNMMLKISKSAQTILSYFMTNPNRSHHLRELALLLLLDPGNLSREMKKLTNIGLFQTSEKGRLKLFSINQKHPLFKDIKGLILKTSGAPALLKNALSHQTNIDHAFLYGSYASGKMDNQSDIDLMIIGKISSLKIAELIRPIEKALGRDIHFRIIDKNEYNKRKQQNDPFITGIMQNKRILLISKE